MRGVFRGGRMPPRKIPPAPRTRCAAPGAQAGCAFFAPGFFAQAKKGGSRRHGAKALDLDLGGTGTAGGSRPALRGFGGQQAGQDPPYKTVAGDAEEQEQLAALAPSSALRAPSPASGRRAVHPVSRKLEKGCSPCFPQAGEGLFNRCPAGGEGLFNRCPAAGEGLLGPFPAGGLAPKTPYKDDGAGRSMAATA